MMISHVVDHPITSRRIATMHGDDVLISPNSGPISLANDEPDIRRRINGRHRFDMRTVQSVDLLWEAERIRGWIPQELCKS